MNGDHEHAVLRRIEVLLEKTVENGATIGEEKSAIQLAYQLTRQYGFDVDEFQKKLSRVGRPPRYLITGDGFLVPATSLQSPPWDGTERRRRGWDGTERRRFRDGGGAAAAPGPECPASPSGKHRMTPIMQGTFRTGFEGCVHCGTRRRL